ncbi:MAG TPA: hypothetical protein VF511_07215, partial [Chthoniobacterales bacterium]
RDSVIGQGGTIGFNANSVAAGAFLAQIDNSNSGRIDNGGDISVLTAGQFQASSLTLLTNNRSGGSIGSGLDVIFDSLGALTLSGSASVGYSARNDANGGGTAGGDVNVRLAAGSISASGNLDEFVSTSGGGQITGNTRLDLLADSDITVGGMSTIRIDNSFASAGAASGGMIGLDAIIAIGAQNFAATGGFEAAILNHRTGVIKGDALLNLALSGSLTSGGNADVYISTRPSTGSSGRIDGDALLAVRAARISTNGFFETAVFNTAGAIGGAAGMDVATTGGISIGSNGIFLLTNQGGTMGSANLRLFSGGGISTGGFLEAFIFNQNGQIGTGGNITVRATGDMVVRTDAFFGISNTAGKISANPLVDVRAANITTGGFFEAYIDNQGGTLGNGGGSVMVRSDGQINVGGGLEVLGTVTAAGDINAQTLISTNVTSTGGNINARTGGIRPFLFPGTGGTVLTDVAHFLTANRVTSQAGINFNGANGNGSTTAGRAGGSLEINAQSLSFGSSEADIIGAVSFNGGAGGGFTANETALKGGDGGQLYVNTTGDISVNSDIEATTGLQPQNFTPGGRGGTVEFNSTNGTVTVNNRIQVSS